jgi:hypothetical protein
MIRVFIGYSRAAPVASSVAALSINRRPHHELQSTDLSFSGFLAPFLCDFRAGRRQPDRRTPAPLEPSGRLRPL